MADEQLVPLIIPLNGKLILSQDPALIAQNFQELKNMRYDLVNPIGVGGMDKLNLVLISI